MGYSSPPPPPPHPPTYLTLRDLHLMVWGSPPACCVLLEARGDFPRDSVFARILLAIEYELPTDSRYADIVGYALSVAALDTFLPLV